MDLSRLLRLRYLPELCSKFFLARVFFIFGHLFCKWPFFCYNLRMFSKNIIKGIFLAAVLGILNAIYLTYGFYTQTDPVCSLEGGCSLVTKSVYNSFMGIPIALFGVIYFGLIIILSYYLYYHIYSRPATYILSGVSLVGLGVSIYLTYLQLFVIESLCAYCLLSAFLSVVIFVLMILLCRLENTLTEKI